MNLSQLAAELGVTRQWLHNLRLKDPKFPLPRRKPGSTRDFWDLAEARTYYRGRELRPGERTDLKVKSEGPSNDPDNPQGGGLPPVRG